MKGFRAPVLWFSDDRTMMMDDHALVMLDELDGREVAVAALPGVRIGAPLSLGRAVAVIPTGNGVAMVQMVGGAQPSLSVLSDPLLTEIGVARLAGDGEQFVAVRADRKVLLVAWQGDRLVRRWAAALPPDAGVPAQATLSAEQVLIADDQGAVFVLGRSDGQVIRRIQHGAPLTAAPIMADGRVVIADREGRVSAYRLTSR
jgi:hypothetical protein